MSTLSALSIMSPALPSAMVWDSIWVKFAFAPSSRTEDASISMRPAGLGPSVVEEISAVFATSTELALITMSPAFAPSSEANVEVDILVAGCPSVSSIPGRRVDAASIDDRQPVRDGNIDSLTVLCAQAGSFDAGVFQLEGAAADHDVTGAITADVDLRSVLDGHVTLFRKGRLEIIPAQGVYAISRHLSFRANAHHLHATAGGLQRPAVDVDVAADH